jgi:uncharacterized membrane-anchored protein
VADITAAVIELHRRANLYAAKVVEDINAHRYHGTEDVQRALVQQLETDIARAYVYGYCARIEDEERDKGAR